MTARWSGHVPSDWPVPSTRLTGAELDQALRDIGKAHEDDGAAPLTERQLDEIAARAAGLYEYATGLDAAWQDEADHLAGTDVPALLAEITRLTAENEALTSALAVPGAGDQR